MRVPRVFLPVLMVIAICGCPLVAAQREVPSEDYPTLAAAVEAAEDGDVIQLAAGTFSGEGFRDIDFAGKAITVRGAAYPETTTLECGGSQDQPHRAFLFRSGEGLDSVLEDLTIVQGDVRTAQDPRGGAILCDGAAVTIRRCTFESNAAESGGAVYLADSGAVVSRCLFAANQAQSGGAVYCRGRRHSPAFDYCTFIENDAAISGGALYAEQSDPSLTESRLEGNHAGDAGGGLFAEESNFDVSLTAITENGSGTMGGGICVQGESSPTVANCTVNDNASQRGGGIAAVEDAGLILRNCLVTGNETAQDDPEAFGGGVYMDRSSCRVEVVLLAYNRAAAGGAGLYCVDSVPLLVDCEMRANRVLGVDVAEPGAPEPRILSLGGAIACRRSAPQMVGGILDGNVAVSGGALCAIESSVAELANCTLVGNRANQGGAVAILDGSECFLVNCILADHEGHAAAVLPESPLDQQPVDPSTLHMRYNLWHNNIPAHVSIPPESYTTAAQIDAALPTAQANIEADPLFAEDGYWRDNGPPGPSNDDRWIKGDYHPQSTVGRWDAERREWFVDAVDSPAIDAGDPSSDWTAELYPHGGRINVGAYGGTPQASLSDSNAGLAADINRDGVVNGSDYVLLAGDWLTHVLLKATDLNRDRVVDTADLRTLVETWLASDAN